uniref:Odorant binding protein 2-like protein n=1 Tax=Anomala corpulenta TaxID=931571 RepID=A0A0A7HGB6_9SCAR|nr:odorant binding protein 2-like protein [Anomala corpulenta]AKC58528.1 odorant binding protein 7 [Anomala corpulenta]
MYRLIILFLCVLGANATTKLLAIFQEHALKTGLDCLSEVDATMDDLKSIINHDMPTTRAKMCLITCIHEKFGIQDANGKMLKDQTIAFLDVLKDDPPYHNLAKDHFLHCLETVSETDEKCTIGANLMRCIVVGGNEKGIF